MLKEQLFSNWYPMRWFMLIFGLVLGVSFLNSGSAISGLLAVVILFQALANTGCLLGHCTPTAKHSSKSNLGLDDITYEEIKTD